MTRRLIRLTPRTSTRQGGIRQFDEGAAIVELPLVFIAFCVFALCFTALGQMFLDYHHISGAARAAARYATKSDYDPTNTVDPSSRRPSDDAVRAFAVNTASPLTVNPTDVQLVPDTAAGNGVDVVVTYTENSGAFAFITGTANGVLSLIGAGHLSPVTIKAHATAIYE